MYAYSPPKSIVINLADKDGFELRQKASNFVKGVKVRGAEAGNEAEQTYGVLAEMVLRNKLGLPEPDPEKRELGWDIKLPSGVKVDVKCRGGVFPFQESYNGSGGLPREAKHNFFARQIWDERLDADIYIMTHLETPKPPVGEKTALPGTDKQRKWNLYVCGWVSKDRVKREGVYLPRGSITEQGNIWFPYRGYEVEFYNQHLNGLADIKDMLKIDQKDVSGDALKAPNLHLTSVDAVRIAIDLIGYGILKDDVLEFLKEKLGVDKTVPPILHPNQYHHLIKWLKQKEKAKDEDIKKLSAIMQEVAYSEQSDSR